MKRIVLSLVVFLLTYTAAVAYLSPATPSYADLARHFCPAEWSALEGLEPHVHLEHYREQQAARELDSTPSQNVLLHRPFLLAMVNAEFVGNVVALTKAAVHTPQNIVKTEAQLNLITCLNPTPQERRDIIQTMAQVVRISESEASMGYTTIFQSTDHMFCMGFDKAFEAVKLLDPTSETYEQELTRAHVSNLSMCDDPKRTTPPAQSPD
jgi:hypothetical protein